MTLSHEGIQGNIKPRTYHFYGAEGRGKSTLACKLPNPLVLLLERGLPRGVEVDAVEANEDSAT
jgi:hypothetical protein